MGNQLNLRNVMGDKKMNKKTFSCPLSPYISWHHGLKYKECPLSGFQRDMPTCEQCQLNDKKSEFKRAKPKKQRPSVEKRNKEKTPVIGKTYTSE
jgi:hypothetical protein